MREVLREEMRKPLKLSKIPEVVKTAEKEGIYTDCNVIIGMPVRLNRTLSIAENFSKRCMLTGSGSLLQHLFLEVKCIQRSYRRASIKFLL